MDLPGLLKSAEYKGQDADHMVIEHIQVRFRDFRDFLIKFVLQVNRAPKMGPTDLHEKSLPHLFRFEGADLSLSDEEQEK